MTSGASLVCLSRWFLEIERFLPGGGRRHACQRQKYYTVSVFAAPALAKTVLSNPADLFHIKPNKLRGDGI